MIFGFLGRGMMGEHLKQEGTTHSFSGLLKICVKMDDSWTAQASRQMQWQDLIRLQHFGEKAFSPKWFSTAVSCFLTLREPGLRFV